MHKPYKTVWKDGKQVRLHRYVMEQHLGRKLLSTELVHHKDENYLNNKIENLEILTRSAHRKIHKEIGASTQFKSKYNITKEELSSLYASHTAYEIAGICNMPVPSVYGLLIRYGIPRRKVGAKP